MADEEQEELSKGERTRERILDVALDLFINQGFHATSTRQITTRLELTRGSIYNHFESKDQIFEAVLEKYHPWFQIPTCVASAEGDTIEEFVHDAAHRLLVAWDKRPELIRLHLIELIEFQGRHLPQLFGQNFEKMTDVLHQLVENGETLASIPVATLSQALLGLFFSYLMVDRSFSGGMDIGLEQNAFEYFTDAYLFGVLNKDNPKTKKG